METAWIELPNGEVLAASTIPLLIESVYETESRREVSRARSILRERIYSTAPPSISDRELVKVAAKRLTVPVATPPDFSAHPPLHLSPPRGLPDFEGEARAARLQTAIGNRVREDDVPVLLSELAARAETGERRWASDRPVSAILLGPDGRVAAFAWNTNSVIRNRHAEWNLCELLRIRGERIARGSTLYVSLKPCRMCAARIWECAEDPRSLSVVYLENDPGRLAQGTLLDARSPARERYFGRTAPEQGWKIQRLFGER